MKIDMSTNYLGFRLAHPVVPSASPLTSRLSHLRQLANAGAPAVVLHSLFEEQIEMEDGLHEHLIIRGTESHAEAVSYFPKLESFTVSLAHYQELIHEARRELEIPIIASLNGSSVGGWVEYAHKLEQAGAQALELNLYTVPADLERSGAEVEQNYLDIVRLVRSRITIPLAVKVSPFFSSPGHMARRFCEAGADALVLFNRFYQADFDLVNLEVSPHLELSRPYEMLLPLTWVSILFGKIPADLALTGGVHRHTDVLKAMMAGARVAQVASVLLHDGPQALQEIVEHLHDWMVEREYHSIEQMQGSMSQARVADPNAFLRANYIKVLQSWRSTH